MNVYRVTCRGMQHSHGCAYVVADNAEKAYQTLKKELDKFELGFHKDRQLQSVELIAEDYRFTTIPRLYLT